MKIAIATVQVPFIRGGAEILADSLQRELRARGFEADIVTIPFKWYPPERLLDCMMMARLTDLTEVNGQRIDRVIALKFPAYYVEHPDKVCWLLHQHRQAYDLFGTEYGDLHHTEAGRNVTTEIRRWDGSSCARCAASTRSRTRSSSGCADITGYRQRRCTIHPSITNAIGAPRRKAMSSTVAASIRSSASTCWSRRWRAPAAPSARC